MVETSSQPKGKSKAGETTLGLLGTLASIAGNLILGPESNIDFGTPFHLGAAHLKQKREEQSLLELLSSTPHTQPIVELGTQVAQAGGLPGLLSHPAAAAPGPAVASLSPTSLSSNPPSVSGMGILPGESLGLPVGNTPGASAAARSPLLATIQGNRPQSIDYGSDEFLQRAATLRPDLAEKILLSKATAKPGSGLNDILDILKIRDYESPDEKRRKDLDKFAGMSDIMEERQRRNKDKEKSYLTAEQTERVSMLDNVYSGLRSLPNEIPELSQAAALVNQVPILGPAVITKTYPQIAQLDKQLRDTIKSKAFADGGKNLTGLEKELTFGTAPSLLEAPSFYPQIKKNYEARVALLKLSEFLALQNNGKNVSEYIDPEVLADYKVWKQIVAQQGAEAFKDPEVLQLMQSLGIDGLIIPNYN